MTHTRREILKSIGCLLSAPAILKARSTPSRLPIAFSTLGCPAWDWKTILGHAAEWGYAAIELRGIQGEMDLTKRPELSGSGLARSLKDLNALSLRVSDLGASARMHEFEPARRKEQLDEGKRFIDLAHKMKVPYVRVFGDKIVEGQSKQATVERIVSGLRELGEHSKGSDVRVLIESHGDFPDSPTLLDLMKKVAMPEIGILWDTHHTFVMGKESPSETFSRLKPYIKHTHIKDSTAEGESARYVLPGAGKVPLREIVRVLVKGGYRGYYCFEWEKAWHKEIEEPEVAFPQYAKVVGGYLKEAGITA
ncbi:MAG TPA: sugar phosphate isomerase/epimerase family protein [Acidobacteriota bacterium]|nr:sugar phosphate isomerase/epimerase family protein [Acidobacteriota bacterium]